MSQTIPARIVIRRDTAAAWTAANPVLLSGEWGFETDARKLKIGNGSSAWNALSYYSTGGGGGGATILTGSGAPSSGTGANGDVYIDTTAWNIYGPKASGAWGAATSLVGPAGATGATGTNGATGPQGPTGATGAAGTNGTNGTAATVAVGTVTTGAAGSSASVSNAGTSSAAVFNFTIPRGDAGAAGATGPQGPAGATGATGATGPTGPAGPVAGSSGQLVYNNAGSAAGATVGSGLTFSGGTLSLTTDPTNASNITSGTLSAARLPSTAALTTGSTITQQYATRQSITINGSTYTLDVTSGNEFVTAASIAGTVTVNLSGLSSIPTNSLWRGVLRFAYTSGTISWFTGNSGYAVKWDGGSAVTPTAGETECVVIEAYGTTIEIAALRGRA
jgi:hypothetical protein